MIQQIALTADFLGKVLLGISVLLVHRHVAKAKKINATVLKDMKKEQVMTLIGIMFITLGYILHISLK